MRNLTHKEIENLCDGSMERRGWSRSKRTMITPNGIKPVVLADRLYMKEGEVSLVFEIKPENAKVEELKKGIGELVCCLPYSVKPYFILSVEQWEIMDATFAFLPWLGVATHSTYSGEPLIMRKKGTRSVEGLIPVPVGKKMEPYLKALTYEEIMYFIERRVHGLFTAKDLKKMLKAQYPDYKVSTQNIGRLLRLHGHRAKTKRGDIGYFV